MIFNSQIQNFLGSVFKAPKKALGFAGDFLENGAHAQQSIPSQHRLKAAGGMFVGWWGLDKLRDYMFGYNQKSEGEYVEIKPEDVPLPLRWLHKSVEWDPYSDSPENLHKKALYQTMPLVGAAVGTLLGSMSAFMVKTPSGLTLAETFVKNTNAKSLTLLEADTAFQYKQSGIFSWLTAAFGGFSAASGLTPAYGAALNARFAAANGARVWIPEWLAKLFGIEGGLKMGNASPAKAMDALLKSVPSYIKAAENGMEDALEIWADTVNNRVIETLFAKDFKNPEVQAAARQKIQEFVEKSYQRHKAEGLDLAGLQTIVAEDAKKNLGGGAFEQFATKELGLDIKNVTLGNANPIFRAITNSWHGFVEKLGVKTQNEKFYLQKVLNKQEASNDSTYHIWARG